MAATGDDAAAMDSISRAPTAHSLALNPAGTSSGQGECPVDATEAATSVPKRPHTNSKSFYLCLP